jgi:hypothetical protein
MVLALSVPPLRIAAPPASTVTPAAWPPLETTSVRADRRTAGKAAAGRPRRRRR